MRPFRYAPKLTVALITRLYASDAAGVQDDRLLEDVGWRLHARCRDVLLVSDSLARCPECRTEFEVPCVGQPSERVAACPSCGWATTAGEYHASWRHQDLRGGNAREAFAAFVERFPAAATYAERMLLVDRLVHAVHVTGGLAARNLFEGRPRVVLRALDALAGTVENVATVTVEHAAPQGQATKLARIDVDLHAVVPNVEALFPYLPLHWRETVTQTLFKGAVDPAYPKGAPTTTRPGAGTDLASIQQQVLDADNVETAVIVCAYAIDSVRHPDAAIAFARAVNDWLVAEWLEREPRLRASIVVPSQLPTDAAREIERVGDHPGFVQVLLPARSHLPWGNRIHHPIWEAIERKQLVAGIHFGGSPGNPPTPEGWPSYYLEEYVDMATVFASQLTSIVAEGVFDAFPGVRVALLEGGFTWLPAHMWRFDKEWRNLRRLVPWVKRAPSAYIREHVRVSVQPLDPPPNAEQVRQVVGQLECDEMLMYASDYPHLHRYDAERDLLAHLDEDLARKIRSENARQLYRL